MPLKVTVWAVFQFVLVNIIDPGMANPSVRSLLVGETVTSAVG